MRVSKAYWIWCQFDIHDTKFINNIRLQVSKYFKGPVFKTHLTIYGPLLTIGVEEINKIKKISKSIKPIEIKVLNYNFTESVYTSFFIEIKKNLNIYKLREKFKNLKVISKYESNFSPHISLVYGKYEADNKVKLIKNLPKLKKKLTINKISIVDVDEKIEKWKILNTFYL